MASSENSEKTGRSLRVETIAAPGGYGGEGLHWFRVEFPDRQGRCVITTSDARHLRQLSTEWVHRAVVNLAGRRGWDWVVAQACSPPGLIPHHTDAADAVDQTSGPTANGFSRRRVG
jgi:hypothetical protein